MKKALLVLVVSCLYTAGYTQFLMDMVDTSTATGKGLLNIYKKFDYLKISGYLQPQLQIASEKGAKSFEGGDFAAASKSRITLRRSRFRFDYIRFSPTNRGPGVQIVLQFDGTERGVFARDMWGRIFENKWQHWAFTAGLFARPFGYETNLASSDRESPERGRMNQLLMRVERDIGMMLTFENRKKDGKVRYLKIDAGFFNGQGLTATADYDSRKDFIGRVALKPYPLSKHVWLSAGASVLQGGLLNNTKYVYSTENKRLAVDSAIDNLHRYAARSYYGADMQLKYVSPKGLATEVRAEYIKGRQAGTAASSETPAALLTGHDGFHIRDFDGAYFYFLRHFINNKHQLVLKYDWYDPNIKVSGSDIQPASGLSAANIRYHTFGAGYVHALTDNLKLMVYYSHVINEKTGLAGYTTDQDDDVFTCRFQFRF